MEKSKKNKKLFVISKSVEETINLDLKDFFEDAKRYLENNTRYIIGDRKLFNFNSSLSLIKKNKNYFKTRLIERKKKEDNENINKKKVPNSKSSLFSLTKMKEYYKQKEKEKYIASLTPREEKTDAKNIYKSILNKKIYYDKFGFTNKNKNNEKKNLKKNLSFNKKDIHYEYKTKDEIFDVFKNYLRRIEESKKEEDLERPKTSKKPSFPPKRKLSFSQIIKANKEEKKKFNIFTNYLSKKCNRDKLNLLISRIDYFNAKKYISNFLQENKLFSERLGNKFWYCNLRRNNNNKNEHKINFVVTGKKDKEPWEQIIDSGILDREYIHDPSVPDIKMKGFNTIDEYKIFKQKFPFMMPFNHLKIDGKNLLKRELSNFTINSSKNEDIKYKLYKDPRESNKKLTKEIIFTQNHTSRSKKK